ncbi:MAG: OmpA family protein [Bacteroidota bacterium]
MLIKSDKLSAIILSLVLTCVSVFTTASHRLTPEDREEVLNYVVVGAFAYHKNAIRFTDRVRNLDMDANYALNPQRNLYYVFVYSGDDINTAIQTVHRVRSNAEFADAWVYTGQLSDASNDDERQILISESSTTEQNIVAEEIELLPVEDVTENTGREQQEETVVVEEKTETTPPVTETKTEEVETVKEEENVQGDYKLYLNVINANTLKEVRGEIELVDNVRAKKLIDLSAHKLIGIDDPNNGKNTVKLVSRIFGFRPFEHIINLSNPLSDSTSSYIELDEDKIIIEFPLQRLRKGDIAVLWNVKFFKDAAIMRPESKYELNSLLGMLNENPAMKIRIHGHTNGNSHGKIIHLNTEAEDKNFFGLGGDHKENVGSAKRLSEYRAYTIQHYLMSEGIPEDRMEIKGWGGKKMVYDKHSSQAYRNVRVEVEVIADN